MYPIYERLEKDLKAKGIDPEECKFKIVPDILGEVGQQPLPLIRNDVTVPFGELDSTVRPTECICKSGKRYELEYDQAKDEWQIKEI